MSNRNPVHEACSRSRCGRRGIPLNHNPVIVLCLEYFFDLTSDQPEFPRETGFGCYVRAVMRNRDVEEVEQAHAKSEWCPDQEAFESTPGRRRSRHTGGSLMRPGPGPN